MLDAKDLVVDGLYRVTDSTGHSEECYFKCRLKNKVYFASRVDDEPCIWNPWRRWEELPEDKHVEYSIETFPLDNSGMVRINCWEDRSFSTEFTIGSGGISINRQNMMTFKEALSKIQWLGKDGKTSVFGVKVEGGE